jgi:predicted transcriptional regulator
MTKLLEKAIATARELSDTEQDEIAELILMIAAKAEGPVVLDAETRAAVEEGMAQARRGEFASDERVAAFFRAR